MERKSRLSNRREITSKIISRERHTVLIMLWTNFGEISSCKWRENLDWATVERKVYPVPVQFVIRWRMGRCILCPDRPWIDGLIWFSGLDLSSIHSFARVQITSPESTRVSFWARTYSTTLFREEPVFEELEKILTCISRTWWHFAPNLVWDSRQPVDFEKCAIQNSSNQEIWLKLLQFEPIACVILPDHFVFIVFWCCWRCDYCLV